MFGRLPLYTRPKEPAIGYPVLTESTNHALTGLPSSQNIGPEYLSGGSGQRTLSASGARGRPDVPSSHQNAGSHKNFDEDDEDDLAPPPPLKINTLQYRSSPPSSSSSSVKSSLRKKEVGGDSLSANSVSTFTQLPKLNVPRKPAPSNFSSSNSTHSTDSFVAPGVKKASTMDFSASRGRGFGLGSVVKGKAAARRKQAEEDLATESPIAVKPRNFVSIDDWLNSREREGLHRRSNTLPTTVATQAQTSRGKCPIRLDLRQSTFAPLATPPEMTSSLPTVPPVPQKYVSSQRPESSRSATPPVSLPPHPAYRLASAEEEPRRPKDHMEELEDERDRLTARCTALRKEIYDLEQVLPPNPSTHNPAARQEMQARRDQYVQELAGAQKDLHETGMKLHRAWRRRDRKTGAEGPTHLWVSRVAGGADS